MYDIEAEARSLDDAGRPALRQMRSRPVPDARFGWLEWERGKVLPKSPIGTGVGYTNRVALARYTESEYLAIDNNASERNLGAVAVGRKNDLFAGAMARACRRLGLDPFAYLRDTLARLPATPADQAGALTPRVPGGPPYDRVGSRPPAGYTDGRPNLRTCRTAATGVARLWPACTTSPRPPGPAIRLPSTNCSASCTTTSADWPATTCRASGRTTPSSRPPWSTRCTSGWPGAERRPG